MGSQRWQLRIDVLDWIGTPDGGDPEPATMERQTRAAATELQLPVALSVVEDGLILASDARDGLTAIVGALQNDGLVDSRVGDGEPHHASQPRLLGGRFSIYLDATDWLKLPQGRTWDDVSGGVMAVEIRRFLRTHPEGNTRPRFLFDPEGDGVSIHADGRDALVRLVQRLQQAGLLDEHATAEPDEDDLESVPGAAGTSQATEEVAPSGPRKMMGPYVNHLNGGLRGYLGNGSHPDWKQLTGTAFVEFIESAIGRAGLGGRLSVALDGDDGATLDGTEIADFEQFAEAVGLAGIDPTEP